MTLLLFWLKIAARRTIYLIKRSPVVCIEIAVIIAAFFVARNDIERTMEMQTEIVILSFFIFVSLLLSLKNYRTMPLLMVYAKSGLRNKHIRVWFFVKQALANNALFLLFGLVSLMGLVITEIFMAIPMALTLSLLLSFSLMYLKSGYISKKMQRIKMKKTRLNPAIKSVIYDYCASGFLQTMVVATGLFVAVAALLIGNIGFLHELENPSVIFIGLLIILSLGFTGIIESVPCANWKFHAILFPRDLIYHIKRTMLFLGVFFGLQIMVFVFTVALFGLPLLLKYLYCMVVMLLLSIHIAFMVNGKLTKAITVVLATAFTVLISTLQAAFLLILIVPVSFTFFKANNEYRERYYL